MKFLVGVTLASCGLYANLMDFKHIDAAQKAYGEGKYEQSISQFKQIAKESPQKQYDLGNALYKKGDHQGALGAYEKAKGVDEAQRLHNVGNTHMKLKEIDKAIKNYEEALKLKEDADTQYNLELAKKLKEQQKKQQKQDKDNKSSKDNKDKKQEEKQKKENKQQKKNPENKPKRDNQQKQEKKDKKKTNKQEQSQEQTKKEDKQGKEKEKIKQPKPSEKKKQQAEQKSVKQAKASEEKPKESKALRRMLNKMNAKQMPTMMYGMPSGEKEQRREDVTPW